MPASDEESPNGSEWTCRTHAASRPSSALIAYARSGTSPVVGSPLT